MLQLSVCIELIFADRDFPSRIDAVAEVGLTAFEFWSWRDKDLPATIERSKRYGLAITGMSLEPHVSLLDGEGAAAFVQAVRESCQAAQQLGCKWLGTLVDQVNLGPGQPWYTYLSDERQRDLHRRQQDNVVRALKEAAPIAEGEGIMLLLECLNTTVDHAGYFIAAWQQGVEIVREVDSPAVGLIFDIYHQQITGGNLISNLTKHIDLVGHLHVADVPGRHEPGTGEINFLNVLGAAKRAGYDGDIGLEYIPSSDSRASLELISQVVDQINQA
jgi:hydroxypyruvate isomerase